MAKPIPKKAARNKAIEIERDIFQKATQARYDLARQAFDAQDPETQMVITRIQKMLCQNANGVIKLWPNGNKRAERAVMVTVAMEYIEMNAFYVAIEILKDLAMMDVRVAQFKFPESFCADCGVKLNDRGKGRKKVKK